MDSLALETTETTETIDTTATAGTTGTAGTTQPEPLHTRDWVRAALWIGAIVVAIVGGWILILASMCGCTMPPA